MSREPATPEWLDEEAGPVVRPYTITGGRVDPSGFDLIAHVVATGAGEHPDLSPEHRAILALAEHPRSVAEVAAGLDLPLGVVRVLLADLHADGLLDRYDPPSAVDGPTEQLLQAVIHGLRAI